MKWMRGSLVLLGVLAFLGLGATFFVEASFIGRIRLVQPIVRTNGPTSSWRLAGDPIELLNVPEKAFVTPGGPGVPAQVDGALLEGNDEVVPYSPIRQTINTARWGALIAIVLVAVGFVALKRLSVASPEDLG